jgi:hypothetical protein
MKICTHCKKKKPMTDYRRNGPWYDNKCKLCANAYAKEYAKKRAKAKAVKWF